MIDKEMFVDNINFLKKQSDFGEELYNLIPSDFFTELTGEYSDKLVDLLTTFFVDAEDDNDADNDIIFWWIYDCNFGTEDAEITITDKNGEKNIIVLDTTEKFYDYLLTFKKEKEND